MGFERKMTIDGSDVLVNNYEFNSANGMLVTVGTNGYCGGDWGHGSRTYIEITDIYGEGIEVKVDGNNFYAPGNVQLIFGGDTELDGVLCCLKYALDTLMDQADVSQEKLSIMLANYGC